jgi:hypothetical protein
MGRCMSAGIVAGSLLVMPATTSSATRMPDGARAWLGTWHANFGTLRVDDVHRARAEYPDASGRRPYYWAAEIRWSRPGSDKRITGTILGGKYRYRTFAGCWKPPDPSVSCGSVLIGRTGKKITGGYWKACRHYCRSHHPWKGRKSSGAWRIGFQFTQHGTPVEGPSGRTQIGGAGALISLVDPDRGKPWRPTGESRIFLVSEGPRGQERRLTIKPRVARYDIVGDDTPRLELRGRVRVSNDERCSVGEVVEVTIIDGKKRDADKIRLDPERGSCDRRARWSSLGNGDVRVSVGFPRETD